MNTAGISSDDGKSGMASLFGSEFRVGQVRWRNAVVYLLFLHVNFFLDRQNLM